MKIEYEIRKRIPIGAQKIIDKALDDLIPTLENNPEAVAGAKKIIIDSLTEIVRYYGLVPKIIPISCLSSRILSYSDNYECFGNEGKIASQEMESLSQMLGIMVPRRERNYVSLEDFPYEEEQWS